MNKERMKYLLKGVSDLHVHTGPSISNRELDAGEMLKDAMEYEYLGFIVKDHYFPSVMTAKMVEKYVGNGRVRVFGGMVMNNSVGGYNLKAVSTAVEMGANFISMPTVSAAEHLGFNKRPGVVPFQGAGKSVIKETPISFLDENGDVDPKAVKVMEYLTTQPQVTFATGHGSAKEVDAVVKKAVELGIKKIHVNHPYFIVDSDLDMIAKWARMGAFIELNACLILPESTTGHVVVDNKMLVDLVKAIGPKQLLLVSDTGQKGNIRPVNAMAMLMEKMMTDAGCTEEEVNIMAKENPRKMLGL